MICFSVTVGPSVPEKPQLLHQLLRVIQDNRAIVDDNNIVADAYVGRITIWYIVDFVAGVPEATPCAEIYVNDQKVAGKCGSRGDAGIRVSVEIELQSEGEYEICGKWYVKEYPEFGGSRCVKIRAVAPPPEEVTPAPPPEEVTPPPEEAAPAEKPSMLPLFVAFGLALLAATVGKR